MTSSLGNFISQTPPSPRSPLLIFWLPPPKEYYLFCLTRPDPSSLLLPPSPFVIFWLTAPPLERWCHLWTPLTMLMKIKKKHIWNSIHWSKITLLALTWYTGSLQAITPIPWHTFNNLTCMAETSFPMLVWVLLTLNLSKDLYVVRRCSPLQHFRLLDHC